MRFFKARILPVAVAAGLLAGALAPAASAVQSVPYQLGTVTSGPAPDGCPKQGNYTCSGLTVSCPGVREVGHAYLATTQPTTTLRGAVALFSSSRGDETWTGDFRSGKEFVTELRAKGMRVIQVWWEKPWLAAAPGEIVGVPKLACRPASVIRWLHDHTSLPAASPGRCGFCVSGSSAGASQIAYALARYGLESRIDVAVLTSGPPHGSLATACDGTDPAALGAMGARKLHDLAYGFLDGGGPCESKDEGWTPRWTADSVEATGDFVYSRTAVRFIFGDTDPVAIHHAQVYADRLAGAGSPDVEVAVVQGMPHNIQNSDAGLAVLKAALTGGSFPGTVPSVAPSAEPTTGGTDGSASPSPSAKPGRTKGPKASGGKTKGGVAQRRQDDSGPGLWLVVAVVAACAAAGGTYYLRRRGTGSPPEPPAS